MKLILIISFWFGQIPEPLPNGPPVLPAPKLVESAAQKNEWQISLIDGSVIRGVLVNKEVDFVTKFGNLKITTEDINRIDFGIHYPDGVEAKVNEAINKLSDSGYKTREQASNELMKLGRWSYIKILQNENREDLESKKRVKVVKEYLDSNLSLKHRSVAVEDKVFAGNSLFAGNIKEEILTINSSSLGELKIPVSNFETMLRNSASKGIRVDSANDVWMDTGFFVESGVALKIDASGIVDLWIQTPGQFICGPNGHQATAGKNSTYKAGALLATIGNTNYFIGENNSIRSMESGNLFLKINPTPWNNASVGSYQVNISR